MKLEDEIQQRKFRSEHQKALINIIYTANWLNNSQAKFMKKFGLTPQQFNILRILKGQHPQSASINLLIERMLDKMSNASRLVEKLRVKGLVEREQCPEDRRQVDVVITEKGLKLLESLDVELVKMESEYKNLISEDEAIQLCQILDKLRS